MRIETTRQTIWQAAYWTMLVSIAPCALPARGMQQCCSSWRVSTHLNINKGYVRPLGRRRDIFVLALGPLGQHSPPDVFDGFDTEIARMQRSLQRMEDQMRAEFQELDKRASNLQKVQGRTLMHPDGSQTYRKEQDFEQRTGSGYFRGYRSESITYYGQAPGPMLPQQMQPGMHAGFASLGLLVTAFLIGAYLAVAARLASIWKRTRYSKAQATRAILLWPFLAVFSQSFRREIREASFRQQHHGENDNGEMA